MKTCTACGTRNGAPFAENNQKRPVCRSCGETLSASPECNPIVGHPEYSLGVGMGCYVRGKMKGDCE